jgi:glycosyltransferase involved in cell wall biosynthesis
VTSHDQPHAPDLSRIAVLMPALNPAAALPVLIREVLAQGFGRLILIDDGSDASSAPIFATLPADPRLEVLRHAVNCGKGRALKTAFNHCLVQHPDLLGVVTADADGQHSPQDIARVAAALLAPNVQQQGTLILGVRAFDNAVPLRSRFGNSLTRCVFRALYGLRIRDTQTGLRAFPLATLRSMLTVGGERYEYESGMLIAAVTQKQPVQEVPIATIYIDGNRGSHFNFLLDSMRIYLVLLRFFISGLLTSAIDFAVFALAFGISGSVATGMLWGRGAALCVNFIVNKRLVFHQQSGGIGVFIRYLALVVLLGLLSWLMIRELQILFGMGALPAKLLAEGVLFVLSFSVQRELVFADLRRERVDSGN